MNMLHGLVLAGGFSKRMGRDKGLIEWHGKPQREFVFDLLKAEQLPVWFSCRSDQASGLDSYPLLVDAVPGAGPAEALLQAHRQFPEAAWLVVACDMPLLNAATLQLLTAHRDPAFDATAFRAPYFDDGSPDPLCAIWEPSAFPVLEARLADGKHCLRKALKSMRLNLLEPPDSNALKNVNTPEELEALWKEKRRFI